MSLSLGSRLVSGLKLGAGEGSCPAFSLGVVEQAARTIDATTAAMVMNVFRIAKAPPKS